MGDIFDAFSNTDPHLAAGGTKIAFKSNRDGFPEVYVADAGDPKSKPFKVATTKNRIHDFAVLPDQRSIVFSTDPAVDERYELFTVGFDGKNLRALPKAEPIQRDVPVFAKSEPEKMFYSARPHEKVETRIFMTGPGRETEDVIYKEPYLSLLMGVDAEARYGLLVRYKTLLDSPIIRVDLKTAQAQRIYPPEGAEEASFTPGFMPDGKRMVVGTNRGGRGMAVLLVDATSGSVLATYEGKPTTANIEQLVISRDGSRIGLLVDAGNHGEVHILDGATLHSVADVALPLGMGHKISMSDDGRHALIDWSSPSTPEDLYAVDTTTGAVTPARNDARGTIDALPPIETSIVSVPSFDGLPIPVNVYLPAQRTGRVPVVAELHGGVAMASPIRYANMIRFFTAHGFAVVEPNIRGSSGFGIAFEKADDGPKREDSFRDITAVGQWLLKQPWADADRLVIGGASYGGYLTLMSVIRDPDLWKAGLEYAGIFDWKTDIASSSSSVDFQKTEFGDISDKRLAELSPKTYVDRIKTPIFVYEGKNDTRVPRTESDALVTALRKRGVTVEYMIADNEGHSIARRDTQMELYSRSLRFLETALHIPHDN